MNDGLLSRVYQNSVKDRKRKDAIKNPQTEWSGISILCRQYPAVDNRALIKAPLGL